MLTLQSSNAEDDLFLFDLYVSTRLDEFAHVGWTEQELNRFLRMQYEMQKQSYQIRYATARYDLVIFQGIRIGRIMTATTEQACVLVDVALLPSYQNRGLGTQLIRDQQRKAELFRKPVRLNVLEGNPAQRLYARLGFYITEHQFPYIAMEWEPSEAAADETSSSSAAD